MPLPVVPHHASDADLLRLYQRTERLWTEHLGELDQLDVGVAVTNPDLPRVHDANRVLEAALPPGVSAEQALAEVMSHFAGRGTRCAAWQMRVDTVDDGRERGRPRPHRPQDENLQNPLELYLASLGYRRFTEDVMAYIGNANAADLGRSGRTGEDARAPGVVPPGVTLLPTRAAFRHARALAEESDTPDAEPSLADARMAHLDDPHCDSLLAMRDGRAVGRVTVFAVGDIGRIDQVYVSRDAQRRGIGRLLIARALEICARSLFRHVMLTVDPANAPAIALYKQFGFRRIGELVNWRSPV